jgi:hypothetical protein
VNGFFSIIFADHLHYIIENETVSFKKRKIRVTISSILSTYNVLLPRFSESILLLSTAFLYPPGILLIHSPRKENFLLFFSQCEVRGREVGLWSVAREHRVMETYRIQRDTDKDRD